MYNQWSKVLDMADWLAEILEDSKVAFTKRFLVCEAIMDEFERFASQDRPWYNDSWRTAGHTMLFIKQKIKEIIMPHHRKPIHVQEIL
jgi:hypothetical protein